MDALILLNPTSTTAAAAAVSAVPPVLAAAAAAAPTPAAGAAAAATFPALEDLNLCACGLSLPQLQRLLAALGSVTAMPRVTCVALGANPGVQEEGFEGLLEEIGERVPGLEVHWRSGDDGRGGN